MFFVFNKFFFFCFFPSIPGGVAIWRNGWFVGVCWTFSGLSSLPLSLVFNCPRKEPFLGRWSWLVQLGRDLTGKQGSSGEMLTKAHPIFLKRPCLTASHTVACFLLCYCEQFECLTRLNSEQPSLTDVCQTRILFCNLTSRHKVALYIRFFFETIAIH